MAKGTNLEISLSSIKITGDYCTAVVLDLMVSLDSYGKYRRGPAELHIPSMGGWKWFPIDRFRLEKLGTSESQFERAVKKLEGMKLILRQTMKSELVDRARMHLALDGPEYRKALREAADGC